MTVEVLPVVACNLGCTGCYETAVFERGGAPKLDVEKVKTAISESPSEGNAKAVGFHGGEATLTPLPVLEEFFKHVRSLGRPMTIQTNAVRVPDALLDLLVSYKVQVGTSLNGPADLNRDRRALPHGRCATDAETDATTAQAEANIGRMLARGLSVSNIIVLSETNAGTSEALTRLVQWVDRLTDLGVKRWRFILMTQDHGESRVELSSERAVFVSKVLAELAYADTRRKWEPFMEMVGNLRGHRIGSCTQAPCDPFHTDGVYAILPDGSLGNCLRPAKDGVLTARAPTREFHRQDALQALPLTDGGCGGCQWWAWCHGGCPGEGTDGDWRNKTRHCSAITAVYELIKRRLKGMAPDWTPAEYAKP